MRQFIKILTSLSIILGYSLMIYFMISTHLSTGIFITFLTTSICIPIFMFVVFMQNVNKKGERYDVKYVITIFKFLLDKKVIHESGNFYIYHSNSDNKYYLYRDYIVFRKIISNIPENNICTSNDIMRWVKNYLDNVYHSKMAKKSAKKARYDLLHKWDGYTSDQLKRDDKINKII